MSLAADNRGMKRLYDDINTLRRRIADLEAQLAAGQHSKDITVVTASYAHKHRRSSITDLDDDSDIDHGGLSGNADDDHAQYAQIAAAESITGVWSFGAVQVNFANGTTYKIESDGDFYPKDIHLSDSGVVYAGTGNDFRLFHDGGNSWIDNLTGNINIRNQAAAGPIVCDIGGIFYIRDRDDGNAALFLLDTSARTLAIGAAADGVIAKLGDGGTTNYAQFAADGELTLLGTARVMVGEDIDIAIPKRPAANPPGESIEDGFPILDFDDGTDESIYIVYHIKQNYAAVGAIHLHVDFFVDTAPADAKNVVWGLEYKKQSHGDNFDFSAGTTTTTGTNAITTGTPANDKKIHESTNLILTTTGFVAHDIIFLRLYRDADHGSDDFVGDVRMNHIHIEYLSDRLGEAT